MLQPPRPILWLAPLALLVSAGCGGSGPEMIPVGGSVKFSDGTVPQGEVAVVRFEPVQPSDAGGAAGEAEIRKGASGDIRPDGSFTLTTVAPGDGVIPGRYKVCFTVLETYVGEEPLVPAQYRNAQTTPFEVTVGPDGASQTEFVLEKP